MKDYMPVANSMREISLRLHNVERHQETFETCTWWECEQTRNNVNEVYGLMIICHKYEQLKDTCG